MCALGAPRSEDGLFQKTKWETGFDSETPRTLAFPRSINGTFFDSRRSRGRLSIRVPQRPPRRLAAMIRPLILPEPLPVCTCMEAESQPVPCMPCVPRTRSGCGMPCARPTSCMGECVRNWGGPGREACPEDSDVLPHASLRLEPHHAGPHAERPRLSDGRPPPGPGLPPLRCPPTPSDGSSFHCQDRAPC